ncbi:MAG: hypothetical protein ACTJG1_13700 [Enterococcus gilvus]
MKKIVLLVGVVVAAFLIFQVTQKGEVEETAVPKAATSQQTERSEATCTNRDLNELDQVTYSHHKELMEDLTGEGERVRKSTKKVFVGASLNEDGRSWSGYFEK